MTKCKAQKVTRRHLATLADQLPVRTRTSPAKLTLAGVFGFLLGAILGMAAGLATASPAIRRSFDVPTDAELSTYIDNLKARAKEFGERRRDQDGPGGPQAPETGAPV